MILLLYYEFKAIFTVLIYYYICHDLLVEAVTAIRFIPIHIDSVFNWKFGFSHHEKCSWLNKDTKKTLLSLLGFDLLSFYSLYVFFSETRFNWANVTQNAQSKKVCLTKHDSKKPREKILPDY